VSKASIEDIDREIGKLIRARRYKIEMGQPALAEALDVTVPMIQKYETGASSISVKRLVQIAEALRCKTKDLMP
jgi:transcriptional regulator with XRE-family HTH domain